MFGRIISFIFIFTLLWMIFTTFTVNKYYNNSESIARETFNLINNERISKGLSSLYWDDSMAIKAKEHSIYMATIDELVHSHMGYGENIAMGAVSSGTELYDIWRTSLFHHANYMSSQYTKGAIGIGFYLNNIQIGDWTITYNISRGYATFIAD